MNANALNPIVRSEARCVLLLALYQVRFSEVSDQTLRKELQDAGHDGSRDWIHKDIHYLAGKGLAAYRTLGNETVMAMLTAAGVDLVEGSGPDVDGVDTPAVDSVAIHQTRERRWNILNVLTAGKVGPVRERTVLLAINDVGSEVSEVALRRELIYLQQIGLVALDTSTAVWTAEITPVGSDLVDFVTPDERVPAGVDRIERYW